MVFEKIQKLCEKNGVSVASVENACGLGNATIRGWQKCDPGAKKLKAVADYFGVSVDDLLREEENNA